MSAVNGDICSNNAMEEVKIKSSEGPKDDLAHDKADLNEVSILQNDQSLTQSSDNKESKPDENIKDCIDLTTEKNEDSANSDSIKNNEVSEKEIKTSVLENGTHNFDSGHEVSSNNTKENRESNFSSTEKNVEKSSNSSMSECCEKVDKNVKEVVNQSTESTKLEKVELSKDKISNENIQVTSDKVSSQLDKIEIISVESQNSKKCDTKDDESNCEKDKSEHLNKNSSHWSESEIKDSALNLNSVNKTLNDNYLMNTSKTSGTLETNPLEKLNEHLNSIGCDIDKRIMKHPSQKDISFSSAVHKSNNKENKNVHSNGHDRFKESPDNFVFAELSNEETGFPEMFTDLVKIGRYISVKGDFTLRSTEALVESPSLVSSYLLKEPDSFPPKEKESKSEPHDYFHSAAGEILIGIGLSRVNEWFHRDMVRIKKRQMKKEGKRPQLEEELAAHENKYAEAKKANSVYSYKYKICKTCGFSTESLVVMEGHKLVPHVTPRKEYQCNFCEVIDKDPKSMLEHMEKAHKKIGRIQPPVLFFECPYCTFESNSKVKLNNHLAKCQRYFDHGVNQAPPRDFEFPALTPKPITVAVVKAYEKSLGSIQRGRGRPKKTENLADPMHLNQFSSAARSSNTANNSPSYRTVPNPPLVDTLTTQNQIISPMPNMSIRPAHSNSIIRPSLPTIPLQTPNRFYQVINSAGQVVPIVGNNLSTPPSQFSFSSGINNSGGKKIHPSGSPFFNSPVFNSGMHQQDTPKSISDLNALPKLTGPYPAPVPKQSNQPGTLSMTSNSLVVCEICDGYIKDLDQLRTHMQLIHKVKIHPKMLVSRPPLNCQKCQWRFFTDQGLERHLLGAHGLVTSNMQELANKNKDAGCCTICGRVYASKLVSHMNQVHKVTLKPAHLSYKCTVCSATFNLYRLFENHVYLVHSGAAKRASESGRSSPSKKLKSHMDKSDSSFIVGTNNHKEKLSKASDEVRICIECGDDILSNKPGLKKCEKCLKSDELIQGTLSTKSAREELRKDRKSVN